MKDSIKFFIIGFIIGFVLLGLPSFFGNNLILDDFLAKITPAGIPGTLIMGLIYSISISFILAIILLLIKVSNVKLRVFYFGLGFYAFYLLSFVGFFIFLKPPLL